MKVTMSFNDDEQEDARVALNGHKYKECVEEIWEQCFRKAFKHGYGIELLDSNVAYPIIDKLSEIYHEVIAEIMEE